MTPVTQGELQILGVELPDAGVAVCVVRCVGGVARTGQEYEAGSLVLQRIEKYGHSLDAVDPPHSAQVRLVGEGAARLRARTVISTDGPRRYGYVGPPELWRAAEDAPGGRIVRGRDDFEAWAAEQDPADFAEPFTYVVGGDGFLRLAPRRSEHVACAGREHVLAAGEVAFGRSAGRPEAVEVSNLSTGYCPDPDCWPAVAAALDRAGVVRPERFTHEIVFRRCTGCGELGIVREGDFVCVFCGRDLPAAAVAGGLS
ncbi:hypothetical protein [Streptomyces sp. NPDC086835]|uniref:hypothetical protein n=1 Tax=Streptomyces sp. NPDC086835 TaxID=3365761 RepID=UPI0037FDA912